MATNGRCKFQDPRQSEARNNEKYPSVSYLNYLHEARDQDATQTVGDPNKLGKLNPFSNIVQDNSVLIAPWDRRLLSAYKQDGGQTWITVGYTPLPSTAPDYLTLLALLANL